MVALATSLIDLTCRHNVLPWGCCSGVPGVCAGEKWDKCRDGVRCCWSSARIWVCFGGFTRS